MKTRICAARPSSINYCASWARWKRSSRASPRTRFQPAHRLPHDEADERRVEDFKDIARMQTSILFDSARAREIQKTDIFGTLARAADYARASRNRPTTLLLLSDMMNETPDVTMTDPHEIPGDSWIRHLAAGKRIPQLRGVCVVVAGADVSTARGAAIRGFWNKYFEAAGTHVSPDNYRNMISDPSEIACPANSGN